MSNSPSVTATISVADKASPALKEMAELAAKLQRTASGAFKNGSADAYTSSLNRATAAAREHLSVLDKISKVRHAIAGTIAGAATYKAAQAAIRLATAYAPYEKEVRYQGAIIQGSRADEARLDRQRMDAARRLGVKPEDSLKAQNVFAQRGFKAPLVDVMTGQALIGSKALGISGDEASRIVEGGVFGLNLHPHTEEEAKAYAKRAADRAAVAAKKSGMSAEGIIQAQKYEFALGTAAGFTPEQMLAINMTHSRNNISGDESGTFARQLAARALAPTRAGLDAEAAAGMKHDDYYKAGDVSATSMSLAMQRHFGKAFSDAQKADYDRILEERPELAGSRAGVQSAVNEVYENSGEKLSKTDARHVSKASGDQFDLARTGFDGKRWLEDFIHKFTPSQVQAALGSKQGGRGVVLSENASTYDQYHQDQNHADGYSQRIADERMQGFGAAVDRYTATLVAAEMEIGKASAVWMTPLTNAATGVIAAFMGLSDSTKAALSVAAAVASLGGLAAAGATVISVITSLSSVALEANLAATSLARIAAAGVLAGKMPGAVPGVVPVGGGPGSKAPGMLPAAGRVLGGAATFLGWGALALALAPLAVDLIGKIPPGSRPLKHAGGSRGAVADRGVWDAVPAATDNTFWHSSKKLNAAQVKRTNESLHHFNAAPYDPDGIPDGWEQGGQVRVKSAPDGDAKWGNGAGAVTVTGTVEGQATITGQIEIVPSPLFNARMSQIDSQIMSLRGAINGPKVGTGFQNDGNSTKASQPARTYPSGGSH